MRKRPMIDASERFEPTASAHHPYVDPADASQMPMDSHAGNAWRQMVAALEAPSETQSCDKLAPVPLALSSWSGFSQVLAQTDDVWVFQYERQLASLVRQARRHGELQAGVFYTPPKVAHYLVARSLGSFLEAQLAQARVYQQQKRSDLITTIVKNVQAIQIIDPACGTGIFLLETLRCLVAFYQQLGALCTSIETENPTVFPASAQWIFHGLTKQVAGVDIDPLALAIAQARVFQWGWQFLCREFSVETCETLLSTWDANAFVANWSCRNTLVKESTLEPTTNLAEPQKRWDFILGNPPYVSRVRGQAKRFQMLSQENASTYWYPKMDLCDAFLAWSVDHLKPGGQLAFVLPEYWTQRAAAAPIRKRLWQEGRLCELRIFPDTPLFHEAPGHHSALLVWECASDRQTAATETDNHRFGYFAAVGDANNLLAKDLQPAAFYQHPVNDRLFYGPPEEIALLERLSSHPPLLRPEEISQGLVLPQGRIHPDGRRTRGRQSGKHDSPGENLPNPIKSARLGMHPEEHGVFLLTEAEIIDLGLNEDEIGLLKPYYLPQGFSAFTGFEREKQQKNGFPQPDYQLIYGDSKARAAMRAQPGRYARLMAHLERFSTINTSAFAPYGLHRARKPLWFENTEGRTSAEHQYKSENQAGADNSKKMKNQGKSRILGLRQTGHPCFAIVTEAAYVNEAFYILRPAEDPAYVTALLNSELAHFWFYHQKRKGHQLQVDKDVLSYFPVPVTISAQEKAHIIALSNSLAESVSSPLHHTDRQAIRAELNRLVGSLYHYTGFNKS